jgi:hypothetical protein
MSEVRSLSQCLFRIQSRWAEPTDRCQLLAHRVISLLGSNYVALGAKRTSTSIGRVYEYTASLRI